MKSAYLVVTPQYVPTVLSASVTISLKQDAMSSTEGDKIIAAPLTMLSVDTSDLELIQ